MSRDFEMGIPTPQTPQEPQKEAESPSVGLCALSTIINFVGAAEIIAGVILGIVASENYSASELVAAYIVGGFLAGLFSFALAVIVDACQKYRKTHKG